MQTALNIIEKWVLSDFSYDALNLSNLSLIECPPIPLNCKTLICDRNRFTSLPPLPKCERLYCSENQLTSLPELPNCLLLACDFNRLTTLPELPKCEIIYCYNNKLTILPSLPNCKLLYSYNNLLTILPNLPNCKELYCENNKLVSLPYLPVCHNFCLFCSGNDYIHINKQQAIRFRIKETSNYNKCAKVIQRSYKNYLRKRYHDVISQYLYKGPAQLVCLFAL